MNEVSIYNEVTIRWMIKRDLDQVLAIENKCFDYCWTRDDFEKTIKQQNCVGQVAIVDNKIVGYIIYDLYDSYYEILNLGIEPIYRQQRIGTMMVNKLLRKLEPSHRTSVITCVREKNLAAQLFFKKHEFICTDILQKYYQDTDEPAYLMEYKLNVK